MKHNVILLLIALNDTLCYIMCDKIGGTYVNTLNVYDTTLKYLIISNTNTKKLKYYTVTKNIVVKI